ncbi:Guanine nucleotide-binding protein subunit alpha [Hondaea fermentalgiana]|uniref:Guanine nucleotide-binding protein subunit alpha n=1 Tax=Hondaea fermentalgiana TaxID=2315210 RepID=A0A2R5G5N3_9STRA|nr:Guanine nucleotide-binding protein subunit alpha [Hondaea fermentalgiana]|eukprot:GBG26347.1 Guanine nucleotide-binding protein subunit alpha [Hondaea fermentalgiana]
MGCASSNLSPDEKAARDKAKKMDNLLEEDKNFDEQLIKLLLLGAGESGKSTIFKQMRILYGEGFGNEARQQTAPVIISNLISGTRTVLENTDKLGFSITDETVKTASKLLMDTSDDTLLNDELAAAIKSLWEDPQFQETFKQRAQFQLFDCYGDFAKSVSTNWPEWGGPGWVPSVSDVMKARVRTSGIVEERYTIDGVNFRMYDVGGQRNERKKWIHCFDGVTAIIFVGAISEYDQVLYEDKTQNRLVEAIELFDEICNSKWFQETSIILFLNKRDLFEEKFVVNKIPLNVTGLPVFESWEPVDWDTESPESAVARAHNWIVKQFLDQRKDPEKEVYHHITCATDTKNVETVFNACKDIILKANLKSSGFMS